MQKSSLFQQRLSVILKKSKLHFIILHVVLKAVARKCSVKKVFLEILKNSKENICASVSF